LGLSQHAPLYFTMLQPQPHPCSLSGYADASQGVLPGADILAQGPLHGRLCDALGMAWGRHAPLYFTMLQPQPCSLSGFADASQGDLPGADILAQARCTAGYVMRMAWVRVGMHCFTSQSSSRRRAACQVMQLLFKVTCLVLTSWHMPAARQAM
jgi:hypothetical protein